MLHLAPTSSSLFRYLVLYPFIIRGLYLLRQSFEPLYMNETCLMDFVRLSSPEHYDVHPLWKYFQQSSNVTCEDLTGMPIEDFFVQVYKSGTTEFYIFYGLVFLYVGISTFCFLRQLFTGKVKSIISVIAMTILAWNQGSLFHLLSHYQNDLYHLNGNVMHHSSFTVGGDNAALVNTLPPGLIINFIMNYVTIWMMTYVIFDYLKLDKWVYLNLAAPMMVATRRSRRGLDCSSEKSWIPAGRPARNSSKRTSASSQLSFGSTISAASGAAARTARIIASGSDASTLTLMRGASAMAAAASAMASGVSITTVSAVGRATGEGAPISEATPRRAVFASRSHKAQSTALRAAPARISESNWMRSAPASTADRAASISASELSTVSP